MIFNFFLTLVKSYFFLCREKFFGFPNLLEHIESFFISSNFFKDIYDIGYWLRVEFSPAALGDEERAGQFLSDFHVLFYS